MAVAAKRIADRAAARVRASMAAQPVTPSSPAVPERNYDRRVLESLSVPSPSNSGKLPSVNANSIAADRVRLQRDIEKRLAARGVKGEAAQQLVSRIADYELARTTAMQASTRVNEFKPVRFVCARPQNNKICLTIKLTRISKKTGLLGGTLLPLRLLRCDLMVQKLRYIQPHDHKRLEVN